MKKILFPTLIGLALAATAQAGPDPMPAGKEIIPPPPPTCLWSWFAGGSVGYVSGDWDEEIYTLHIGTERKCQGDRCSHAFFLEVGYTEKDESDSYHDRDYDYDYDQQAPSSTAYDDYHEHRIKLHAEIIPITLNYKYECTLTGNLNWYVGAGAGIALVDLDASDGHSSSSWDDTTFYAHIFAGILYNVSESFEITLGVRYLIMDDPSLTGLSSLDSAVSLDGDAQVAVGARINF